MDDLLSSYDYDLPPERIAQHPLADRASSRLLLLNRTTGKVSHHLFRDCVTLLEPGDLLVVNNTRVSAVRLHGKKADSGGDVELLLLREHSPTSFEALAKPARSLRQARRIVFCNGKSASVQEELSDGRRMISFDSAQDAKETIAEAGLAPLPPYITESLADRERYQTVYGAVPGSAAAPTAGLHFTPDILAELRENGVSIATVTLHVGIDTFRPVHSENITQHVMHGEHCELPKETAEAIETCPGRVIAVGTTSVRTLESFADGPRRVRPGVQTSHLFIRPGHCFQVVEGMFTNFHMPRTTLMMLISAFAGREFILRAYEEAVKQEYRFLSFGDSMLIL